MSDDEPKPACGCTPTEPCVRARYLFERGMIAALRVHLAYALERGEAARARQAKPAAKPVKP